MVDLKAKEWDESYKVLGNYLFYPHEEIIRFVNKYVIKRMGISIYKNIIEVPVMIDVGCGIGRHVIYGLENNIDSYGFDLSVEAVDCAKKWAKSQGIADVDDRFKVSDIKHLPWRDGKFNVAISHGVLDSMPFEIARAGIKELHRVTSDNALFYCDLIRDDSAGSVAEEIVSSDHEKGTVQSYFNEIKINKLFKDYFSVQEMVIVNRVNSANGTVNSRFHLIMKRL